MILSPHMISKVAVQETAIFFCLLVSEKCNPTSEREYQRDDCIDNPPTRWGDEKVPDRHTLGICEVAGVRRSTLLTLAKLPCGRVVNAGG